MSVTGIAFVMYPVSDIARAVAFYQDVLGLLKAGIDQPYWVEFEVAGATFGVGTFELAGKPGTAQSLAIEVADMTEFRAGHKERGYESNDPYETPICFVSMVKTPTATRSGCTSRSGVEQGRIRDATAWPITKAAQRHGLNGLL